MDTLGQHQLSRFRADNELLQVMQEPGVDPRERRDDLEMEWSNLYDELAQRGYILRPRYRPTWQPSWVGKDLEPMDCEDAIVQDRVHGLDAVKNADSSQVYIKRVNKMEYPTEAEIALFLSSQALLSDRFNHTVPILDHFGSPDVTYLVMPLLRPFNDPPFTKTREAVDFVNQTLEGLVFMHEHNVAHRDCSAQNIMMDARDLYPKGWHPVYTWRMRDGKDHVKPHGNRCDVNIKYYFIDFGLSTRFAPGEPHLVVGAKGAAAAPELSRDIPYDPFKLDVYLLGKVFQKHICEVYGDVSFLEPLVKDMTAFHPDDRPTALDALKTWKDISKSIPLSPMWPWLHKKDASVSERLVEDVTSSTIYMLNRLTSL